MRAKTVQCVRGGRLRSERTFFFITPKDESCVDKKHTVSTEKHAQEKYARYKLIETGERRRPGAFCCDHFYTFSLLVVVVDVFLCSSSFRRRLRRAMMMIGDE